MSREEETNAQRVTRRTFVASGVAAGAAVVWTSPFPFSDSPIGQTAEAQTVTGPTGTATPSPSPTGTATPTGNTGPTGNNGGGNRPTKLTINAKRQLKERKGGVVVVPITVTGSKAVKGSVKLDTLVNGRRRSLGTARFSTPRGGGARNVRVKLNRLGRELSADRKRIPARVTAATPGVTPKRKAVAIKTLSA